MAIAPMSIVARGTDKGARDKLMTVGKKISLTCALLVLFTIATGAVALLSIRRMETAMQSIVGDALPGVYSIGRVESVAKDILGAMLTHVASDKQEIGRAHV
jgi:hypothetical protein